MLFRSYQIVNEFPYGKHRDTSRTVFNQSDHLSVNLGTQYRGQMTTVTRYDMNGNPSQIDVQGKTMAELGISLDERGYLDKNNEDYAPYLDHGYALWSDYSYPKEIWQWFWRNAIQYHCYDMEEFDGTNEQVFFYIDEKNVRAADKSFKANDGNNPTSSWTAPFDATYQIDLWGAGGGNASMTEIGRAHV